MRKEIDQTRKWLNSINETFDLHSDKDDLICDNCGNKIFNVNIRYGGGGSGTYLRFKCVECDQVEELDFENPDYDG